LNKVESEQGVGKQRGAASGEQPSERPGLMADQAELLGDLSEGRLNSIAQDSDRSTGSSREVLALGPGGRKHHLDPVLPVLLGPRLAPKPSIEQQPIQDRPTTRSSATARSSTAAGTMPHERTSRLSRSVRMANRKP
jgi:hypothetical protein